MIRLALALLLLLFGLPVAAERDVWNKYEDVVGSMPIRFTPKTTTCNVGLARFGSLIPGWFGTNGRQACVSCNAAGNAAHVH